MALQRRIYRRAKKACIKLLVSKVSSEILASVDVIKFFFTRFFTETLIVSPDKEGYFNLPKAFDSDSLISNKY